MGVEPTLSAWEAGVLPINYIRIVFLCFFILTYSLLKFNIKIYMFYKLLLEMPYSLTYNTLSFFTEV